MLFTNLPPEILSSISSYLDFKASCQLRLTSKIFSEIAASGVFNVVYLGFFLESLAKLEKISKHPLRNHVKKLIICGEPLNIVTSEIVDDEASDADRETDSLTISRRDLMNFQDDDLPAGLTINDLDLHLYDHVLSPSYKSYEHLMPRPIRAIGPYQGKPVVLIESGFGRFCSFYDVDGRRITCKAWLEQGELIEEPLDPRRHNKYAFEQIAWQHIAADKLDRLLPFFKNVKEVAVCPISVRAQHSEPFWYNMRSKLYLLPDHTRDDLFRMRATKVAVDCFLKSVASSTWSLTSLDLVLQLPIGPSAGENSSSDLTRIFHSLRKLHLGLVRLRDTHTLIGNTGALEDLMKSIEGAERLEDLNIWVQEFLGRMPQEHVDIPAMLKGHWPYLCELKLGYMHATERSLSRLLQRHASTLRSLDLKTIIFPDQGGHWPSFVPTLPNILPSLDWFWADNLQDHGSPSGPQSSAHARIFRYGFPLHDAVLYRDFCHNASINTKDTETDPTNAVDAASIFNTAKWPEMCQAASIALKARFNELWTTNGLDVSCESVSGGIGHVRRQADNMERRLFGL